MNFDILTNFPLTSPIPIFLLVLLIILGAPILSKFKIPQIVGLIFAGIILGPYGLNILDNDKSFELFGGVGLLYIMFIAGLEIDINTFKRNQKSGIIFGILTFAFPMIFGILSSYYLLGYSMITSVLLASMYASHTLVAYPIVSRLGVSKNRAVSITIGGTIITVTLALIILAFIVAQNYGAADAIFWVKMTGSTLLFCGIVFFVFPKFSKWFLGRYNDNVVQYIYVLALVFVCSLLAVIAGLEGIIGAFFAGLILNRLIPTISPLMNRIDFVGNALFIPFFLISIGMMVDIKAFVGSYQSILVAVVMSVVATFSKWLAAIITQKSFKMKSAEGLLMFGLSNGQAAATLAAVAIGYELGILNIDILNGTIVMILVTCSISSVVTEYAAKKVFEDEHKNDTFITEKNSEKILIPIGNPETTKSLIEFAVTIKDKNNRHGIMALNIIKEDEVVKDISANRTVKEAADTVAATDNMLEIMTKKSINIVSGIKDTCAEKEVTDILLGFHHKTGLTDNFLGNIAEKTIKNMSQNIIIYKQNQPLRNVRRLILAVPKKAELESGFEHWFAKIVNISKHLNIKIEIFTNKTTQDACKRVAKQYKISISLNELHSWEDFLMINRSTKADDLVVVVSSRKLSISHDPLHVKIPYYLYKYYNSNNYAIIFPKLDENIKTEGTQFHALH